MFLYDLNSVFRRPVLSRLSITEKYNGDMPQGSLGLTDSAFSRTELGSTYRLRGLIRKRMLIAAVRTYKRSVPLT
jgi:hypothetical protein